MTSVRHTEGLGAKAVRRALTPKPQQVEIVRPARRWAELVGGLIGTVLGMATDAYLVMLLAPMIAPTWHVSYPRALAFVVVALTLLRGGNTPLDWWSRRAGTR